MHRNRFIASIVLAALTAASLAPGVAKATPSIGSGTLDQSFGHHGFTVVQQQVYSVNDVRVDRSGDILVAVDFAGLGNAIGGFGIARLLPNGAPDDGFGSGGIAVAEFGNGLNVAMSTATQSDGKVVAVGASRSLQGVQSSAIARFTSTGALDTQFGSAGRVSPAVPGASGSGADIVLTLANGDILIGGSAMFASGAAGILIRLSPDGSLDASFGNGGIVNTGLAGTINGIGLQSNGKIVALAGTNAARFLANGAPDQRQTRSTLVAETHVGTSALLNDERIVAAFGLRDGGSGSDVDTQAMRFFPNGSVDGAFSSPLFDFITTDPDVYQNVPHAVAIEANGSVVVGGGGQPSIAVTEFALARLLSGGRLDRTFGRRGIVVSSLTGNCAVYALGMQANGDIVAAGQAFNDGAGFVVARYLP